MRTVKIVKGAYGYRKEGSRITEPKTRTDPPFDLPAAEAARIVDLGVAEYYTAPVVKKPSQSVATPSNTVQEPEYHSGMKLAELKDIAATIYGVGEAPLKSATSKAKVIELIETAKTALATIRATAQEAKTAETAEAAKAALANDAGDSEDDEDDSADDGEPPPELGTGEPVT